MIDAEAMFKALKKHAVVTNSSMNKFPLWLHIQGLDDAIAYFDERADADYVDDIGRAEGNEEMRLRDGLMRLREKLAGGGA